MASFGATSSSKTPAAKVGNPPTAADLRTIQDGPPSTLNRHSPPPKPSNRENAPFDTTPSNRPAGAELPLQLLDPPQVGRLSRIALDLPVDTTRASVKPLRGIRPRIAHIRRRR